MLAKYLILIIIISSISKCLAENKNFHNLIYTKYILAQKKICKCQYQEAIKILETINNTYPISDYTQKIQINLIYAYYKKNNLLKSQSLIDIFLKFNPTHVNRDYVIYIHGIISMILDSHFLDRFLFLNNYDYNPEHAQLAFSYLKKLVDTYPNSKYRQDAIKRLIYLKNRLARYEFDIIKYYMKKKCYLAVINRTLNMLVYFQDTQAAYQALFDMKLAYQKLNMYVQANKIKKIIEINLKNNINKKFNF